MKLPKFIEQLSEFVFSLRHRGLVVPLFFALIASVAAPVWSWGAFCFIIVFLLYLLHVGKKRLGVYDHMMRSLALYGVSLYLTGIIAFAVCYAIEAINYVTILLSAIPMVIATLYVNKTIDKVEATVNNIELLKPLRVATLLPLLYILLASKTWSVDAGIYGMIPYIIYALHLIIKNSRALSEYQKKGNYAEVDEKATIQRPSSPLKGLIIVAVICVAIHLMLAFLPIGFDSMILFDSSLFKVALPLCILGCVIIYYYPKWECRVLGIEDKDNSYIAKRGTYIILSMLSGIISALVGFEDPKAGAAMLCFIPILAMYDAYVYTYNPSRRVYNMIFVFIINLVAGFIGISAVWLLLFMIIVLFFIRLGTSMVAETILNPFPTGIYEPDGSRILVWDPELGRSIELHNTGAGLFDPSGNPWERGLAGGFKPQGSDRPPLSGQEV